MIKQRKKVAFICVHNSCRSQIAEALGNYLIGDCFECYSAGTEVKPQINQDAVRIMKEMYGIDMEKNGQHSKLINEIPEPDIVISMGCDVGCPFIGRPFDDNWELKDPTGQDDGVFLDVVKEIEKKIMQLNDTMKPCMSHAEKAVVYYSNNFNCSQAVFTSYATELGIDEKLALKLGTSFGGGARKGEMCGAVAGALMVLGLICGHSDSTDLESKARAYSVAEEYMNRFIQKNGSVVCRDLLGYDLTKPEDMEQIKEKNLFRTTCPQMVRSAAEILDEITDVFIKS